MTSVQCLLLCCLTVWGINGASGEIQESGDAVGQKSDFVQFSCTVDQNDKSFQWNIGGVLAWHQNVGESAISHDARYTGVVEGNKYTLTINNLQMGDSSTVTCTQFPGTSQSMQLTVVDGKQPLLGTTSLVDNENTVPVVVTCSVSYEEGSTDPGLSIRAGVEGNLGSIDLDEPSSVDGMTTESGTITYKPSWLDNGKDMICQYENYPFNHPTRVPLKIDYSPRNLRVYPTPSQTGKLQLEVHDKVNCTASSSPGSTYEWRTADSGSVYSTPTSELDLYAAFGNQETGSSGRQFTCTATNSMGEATTNVTIITSGGVVQSSSSKTNVAAIVAPIVVILVIIIIIVVVVIIYKKRKGGSGEKYPPSDGYGGPGAHGGDGKRQPVPAHVTPVNSNPVPNSQVNPGYHGGSDPVLNLAGRESPAGHGSLGPPQLTPQLYKRQEYDNNGLNHSLNDSFM